MIMKNKAIVTVLCALMAVGSFTAGCGMYEKYAGNEISYKYKDKNIKMIGRVVKVQSEYIDQLIALLEKIEPGCRITSMENADELDRVSVISIKTENGKEYIVSIFKDGGVGNIADRTTGDMLFPSDWLPREDDADYPIATDVNTGFLMIKGISKENAQKIAEVVDHGAPNALIDGIEGYDPDRKDIKIVVYMETGKAFHVTVMEENEWNATITDY